MKLEVYVPDELEPFEGHLRFFFETMVRKLHINRHKGFAEGDCIEFLLAGVDREFTELRTALRGESQFNASMEAADVANFAFLVALKTWDMTVHEYKEKQKVWNDEREGQ